MEINDEIERIQTTTLTNIAKRLYLLKEFIKEQEDSLKFKEKDFMTSFDTIKVKMMNTYDLFIYRG